MIYNLVVGLDKLDHKSLRFDLMKENSSAIDITWDDEEYGTMHVEFRGFYMRSDPEDITRLIVNLKNASIHFLEPELITNITFFCKEKIKGISTFIFEEYDGNRISDVIDFSDKIGTVVTLKQI